MRKYYFALYSHSIGKTWRVYEVWFWQSLIDKINNTLKELEEDKNFNNIGLDKIEKI